MKPFPLECNLNLLKPNIEVNQGKTKHYSRHLGKCCKKAQIKGHIRYYYTQSELR